MTAEMDESGDMIPPLNEHGVPLAAIDAAREDARANAAHLDALRGLHDVRAGEVER